MPLKRPGKMSPDVLVESLNKILLKLLFSSKLRQFQNEMKHGIFADASKEEVIMLLNGFTKTVRALDFLNHIYGQL